mmetsp:Transcript_20533/g.31642  ORF Transcript_20533/g.31642 Transcript_20533/m.31642 type:complete len:223 (-) Transcript_20533:350-1018(-)
MSSAIFSEKYLVKRLEKSVLLSAMPPQPCFPKLDVNDNCGQNFLEAELKDSTEALTFVLYSCSSWFCACLSKSKGGTPMLTSYTTGSVEFFALAPLSSLDKSKGVTPNHAPNSCDRFKSVQSSRKMSGVKNKRKVKVPLFLVLSNSARTSPRIITFVNASRPKYFSWFNSSRRYLSLLDCSSIYSASVSQVSSWFTASGIAPSETTGMLLSIMPIVGHSPNL